MANRDKSQNVGFVYTNIYQIYKNAQNAAPASNAAAATAQKITSEQRVWRAEDLADLKVTKFEPRTLAAARPVLTAADANAKVASAHIAGNPFDDLKANLTKLQDLHSKLRFMLTELEGLVGKK